MSVHRNWIIGFAVFIVMVIHLLILLVYALPDQFTGRVKQLTAPYVYPQFYQNWQLFAPTVPKATGAIQFRFRSHKGVWSEWKRMDQGLDQVHEQLRVGYPGRVALGAYSMLDLLTRDAHSLMETEGLSDQLLTARLKGTWAYWVIRGSALQQARNYMKQGVAGLEIKATYTWPGDAFYTRSEHVLFFQEFLE